MFKKTLVTAAVVCAVPALASASWFLSTQARSAGGTVTTTINGVTTDQKVAAGTIFKSYTTSAGVDVVVTPDPGFTITSYTKNGVTLGSNASPLKLADLTTTLSGDKAKDKDFSATFSPTMYAVKATMDGGSVTPAAIGNLYKGYELKSPVVFTFSPRPGYKITSLTGVPADITAPALPTEANKSVQVTFPAGYKFDAGFTVAAVATNVTAALNPVLAQSVTPGTAVTLSASGNLIDTTAATWAYVSGPKNTVSNDIVQTAKGPKVVTTVTPGPAIVLGPGLDRSGNVIAGAAGFTAPTEVGQYKFTVTAGGQTILAVVNVTANGANSCQFCHTANGIADSTIGTRYAASIHGQSTHSSCNACHFGGGSASHPGSINTNTVSATTFSANMDGLIGANGTVFNTGGVFCATCHTGNYPIPHPVDAPPPSPAAGYGTTCVACHTAGSGDAHDIQALSVKLTPAVGDSCIICHSNRNNSFAGSATATPAFLRSAHYDAAGQNTKHECMFCHGFDGTTATTAHGKAPSCDKCHSEGTNESFEAIGSVCAACHGGGGHPHGILTTAAAKANNKTAVKKCVECHSTEIAHPGNFVDDNNNGVRAITTEFQKWSHHVTGVTLDDAHCAACHLEGTVANGNIVIDETKHMVDNKTHLRDTSAGTDADFAWDPTAPNHTGMDNFCMSCHDDNGAVSPVSADIQALINAKGLNAQGKNASPTNPFGDTISNRYDKMMRPAVVDAKGQFNPSNPSHHAVGTARYTKRSRVINADDPRAMNATEVAAFTNNSGAVANGKLPGARTTIYDAGKFVAIYETLSPVPGTSDKTLGDDSVLHCGDCHTVGQYKAGAVQSFKWDAATKKYVIDNAATAPAIGAHGSNNEYMLRNSLGTDQRHVGQTYSGTYPNIANTNSDQPYLVCFNCHRPDYYGDLNGDAAKHGHANEYVTAERCNGPVNTITFSGYTTGNSIDGEQYATRLGEGQADIAGSTKDTDFSNLFGMQCANCHNAGPKNGFGGIHGAKVQTYTDANGAAQKAYRFMPGLGNVMYVPGNASGTAAGIGSVSDLNWEVKEPKTIYNGAKTEVVENGGCYTIVPEGADGVDNASFEVSPAYQAKAYDDTTKIFGTWGGCDDHRGNTHGKAFAQGTQGPGNKGVVNIDPANPGTVSTGGAGVIRKVLRPVTY